MHFGSQGSKGLKLKLDSDVMSTRVYLIARLDLQSHFQQLNLKNHM